MASDDDRGNAPRQADPSQIRFFLLDQQGGKATLLQHIRVEGPVDQDRMATAARAVCRAQPALRTSLCPTPDGLLQRTHPAAEVDIATATAPDRGALDAWIEETRAPFTHGTGPLCRVRIIAAPGVTHCLVGVHHAVFDEDSAAVLLRQLARAYAEGPAALPAVTGDRPPPDPRRPAVLHAFWAEHLGGAPADTALPRIATAGQTGHGTVSLPLTAELAAAMRRRTRETGATPFAQTLAAVAVLTGWYAGTDDVVLATVAGTRGAADAEVIGCLQNTLPVRLRLDGADTDDVLDRTVDALFDAVDHRDLPIEDILALTGAARTPGRKPLTQVICTQATAPAPLTTGDLRWQLTPPPEAAQGEYDLAVTLEQDAAGGLALTVGHDRTAMSARAAQLFAGQLARALAAFGIAPAVPLTALRLHTPGPPPGPAAVAPAPGPPVPDLIAGHARRTPRSPALIAGAERVDHGELDRRITRLAAALIEAGVRPGDRVGVCLPRTADLVVALVAVWRAGAAYLPLDPAYPPGRLRLMVEDACPAVVIGDARSRPVLAPTAVPVIAPDTVPGGEPERWPAVRAHDPAYVIHTSGTTGRPKGVVVRHENLSALLAAFDRELPTPPAVSVAGTSVSFDISALELFWPLATGRTVLLTSHREIADDPVPPGALYQCTPTMARILADDPAGRRLLGGLAVLLVGGEPLPRDLADRLTALVQGPVLNCYGPTETTVWSTVWRVRPQTPVHIGHPLAGEEYRIVDAHDRPLPPGVPGRLLILGAGVGSGYWRRPEQTAARFAEHDGLPGYDTGDLAVLDPDHGLRFLGRADTQVKILGQRIELAEIEAVLRAHPAVRESVVCVTGDGIAVTACLIPADRGLAPDDGQPAPAPDVFAEQLRRHAADSLVPAMIPAAWLLTAELPQLPNGKLDRAAVAGWAARSPSAPDAVPTAPAAAEPVAGSPSAQAVEAVRGAWEQVLATRVEGLDTHFFDLGGTSAQILRVLALLRERYPRLTTADLFRYTTVRAVARHVGADDADSGQNPGPSRPAVRAAARTQALNGWRRRAEPSR